MIALQEYTQGNPNTEQTWRIGRIINDVRGGYHRLYSDDLLKSSFALISATRIKFFPKYAPGIIYSTMAILGHEMDCRLSMRRVR